MAEKKCGWCVNGPDRLLFFFLFFCTGVFVPMDIRIPMRMLYFKLESWQTQLQQILVNSDTNGNADNTGAFQDGLEHRITTTQNGNAKALFKKTGGEALIDGTVVAQEGGGGDGLSAAASSASSQYKKTNRLKKNETKEIHRIAVEGTTTNSIGNTTRHQSAVYHWIATKAAEGSSEEEDSDSEAQQESKESTESTESTEQQEAVPTAVGIRFENMRASILSSQVEGSGTLTTLVTGDAVW
jgi:hypothetical protein